MTVEVRVRRWKFNDEHMDQKCYVIEGYVEGCPAVTKRDNINIAAIASGDVSLQKRIDKMKADVAEYYQRWLTLQSLPDELE